MIATVSSIGTEHRLVAQTPREVLRVSDSLRAEASRVLDDVLAGVTCKQIDRASVPTCHKTAVSRALNGGDSNPLYKLASVFLLMKRCGLSRSRAQRVVDWLQEVVDAIWPEETAALEDVLDTEQELDGQDDGPQLKAVRGCVESMRAMLEVKRRQRAHDLTVILALRRRIEAR